MSAIAGASAECLHFFEQLCASLVTGNPEHRELMPIETVKSEYGRFKVWCGNLGALQRGHSSLDFRLRESSVMEANVIKLLSQLKRTLKESVDVVSGQRPPLEKLSRAGEDSDESQSDSSSEGSVDMNRPKYELQLRLSSVVDILSNLYRLSFKIRNPNLKQPSIKGSSFEKIDPESGIELFSCYLDFDRLYVDEVLRELRNGATRCEGESEYLTTRLASALTDRRKYFKYWRRHADKLAGDSFTTQSSLKTGQPLGKSGNGLVKNTSPVSLELAGRTKGLKSLIATSILSATEATTYDQKHDDKDESQSVASYTTTVVDAEGHGLELPPPPKDAANGKDFMCPYCAVICPARHGRGRSWRAHILRDLQPYVCTYADCPESSRLYSSRRQWVEHENNLHRRIWRCYEHSTPLYNTAKQLEAHLRADHAHTITEMQITDLVEVAETSVMDSRPSCPVCWASGPFPKGLENHVANHLERIAVFALPKSFSKGEDESNASSNASQGRGSRSQHSWGSSSLLFSEMDSPRALDLENEKLPGLQGGSYIKLGTLRDDLRERSPRKGSSLLEIRQLILKELSVRISAFEIQHSVSLRVPYPVLGHGNREDEAKDNFLSDSSLPEIDDIGGDSHWIGVDQIVEKIDKRKYGNFEALIRDIRSMSIEAYSKSYSGEYTVKCLLLFRDCCLECLGQEALKYPEVEDLKNIDVQSMKFRRGKIIGSKSYSLTRECFNMETGVRYAAKAIDKRLLTGRLPTLRGEVADLQRISQGHPGILSILDFFELKNDAHIVLELTSGGDMFERVAKKGWFYESDGAHAIKTIISCVAYLHDREIIHHNLKAENIFYRSLEEDSDCLLDISDQLLLSTSAIPFDEYQNERLPNAYTPPETFKGLGTFGKPIDMWSVGVLTYFVLCGYLPFDRDSPLEEAKAVANAEYSFIPEKYWKGVSLPARNFIDCCLVADPTARITAHQALGHPWLYGRSTQKGVGIKGKGLGARKIKIAAFVVIAIRRLGRINENAEARMKTRLSQIIHMESEIAVILKKFRMLKPAEVTNFPATFYGDLQILEARAARLWVPHELHANLQAGVTLSGEAPSKQGDEGFKASKRSILENEADTEFRAIQELLSRQLSALDPSQLLFDDFVLYD